MHKPCGITLDQGRGRVSEDPLPPSWIYPSLPLWDVGCQRDSPSVVKLHYELPSRTANCSIREPTAADSSHGSSLWDSSAPLGSARLGSARLCSALLGSARLRSAPLGSARSARLRLLSGHGARVPLEHVFRLGRRAAAARPHVIGQRLPPPPHRRAQVVAHLQHAMQQGSLDCSCRRSSCCRWVGWMYDGVRTGRSATHKQEEKNMH